MESAVFYIATILAFAPALVLMYALVRNYTYPKTEHPYFGDPMYFGLFAVGLIAGTLMFMAYTYVMSSLLGTILLAAIQCLAVVVVMNLKRFRGHSESIFYGMGFGIGAGCTTGTGFIYYIATATDSLGDSVDVAGYAFLFMMSLAMIIEYTAVGINIGDGIARHAPMQYAASAMIWNIIFWVVVYVALKNSDSGVMYVAAFAAFILAAIYLYVGAFRDIPQMVREVDAQNKKGKKKKKDDWKEE
jgi:hypothetical protein